MAFSRSWTLTFWPIRVSIEHSIAGQVYSLFLKDPIHFTPVEDRNGVRRVQKVLSTCQEKDDALTDEEQSQLNTKKPQNRVQILLSTCSPGRTACLHPTPDRDAPE